MPPTEDTQFASSQEVAASLFFERAVRAGAVDPSSFDALCAEFPHWREVFEILRVDVEQAGPALRGVMPGGSGAADVPGVFASLQEGGTRAGRFRDLGVLGRGGMGIVRKVWDPELRRVVALKTLIEPAEHRDPLWSQRTQWRLLAEAQIVGQLQHPGIVPVLEVGLNAAGQLYFTMPLVAGEGYDAVLGKVRAGATDWSLTRAIVVLQRVAETAAYAHARGVLHRDLKPANVMVGAFGQAYVMDWGLARIVGGAAAELPALEDDEREGGATALGGEDGEGNAEVSSARQELRRRAPLSPLLSHVGDVVGTPAYMAPEQAQGKVDEVDARVDVYSIGAMLYELLAGHPPYSGGRRSAAPRARGATLERVRAGPPPALSRLATGAPEELVAIADKAMARDPAVRYPTAMALADDLRAFLELRVVSAHRTGALPELSKWMARHRGVVVVMALLLLTLLGSALGFAALYREADDQLLATRRAQADALRRQSALRGIGPTTFPLPTFSDVFDDDRLDRRWIGASNAHLIEEVDGALRLAAPAAESTDTMLTLDRMVSVVQGEFELTVSFALHGFDVPGETRHERLAGVGLRSTGDDRFVAGISRHAERDPPDCVGAAQTYCASFEGSDCLGSVWRARDDRRGRMRFVRQDGALSQSYWDSDGGWQVLRTDPAPADDLYIVIWARNFYATEPFRFDVESIDYRTLSERRREPVELVLDFSDGWIDPRLQIAGDFGIVAEIDDTMFLEKLAGSPGWVAVNLDADRYALCGDFELVLQLELDEFSAPAAGAHALHLGLRGIDGTAYARLSLLADARGRGWRSWQRSRVSRSPSEGDALAIVVHRRGTVLRFEVTDELGTREVLRREHVGASVDLSFGLELSAVDSEAELVVGVNRLWARNLQPR